MKNKYVHKTVYIFSAISHKLLIITSTNQCIYCRNKTEYFDQTCAVIVHRLKKRYPHTKNILVIPYRDFRIFNDSLFDEIIYPFESHTFSYYTYKSGSPKRNRWAVDHSSVVICYVYRAGGADKTLDFAKKQKLKIIDLTKSRLVEHPII